MVLHIKKGSLYLANFLYYGGLIVILLSTPVLLFRVSKPDAMLTATITTAVYAMIFSGGAMSIIGGVWTRKLYCCPNCSRKLLSYGPFGLKPPPYCGHCGIKITISIDDVK